ncbi:MAG TPA: hypothetical protein DCQ37_13685 [Desulfobacteraceae bacterium]|nr:hypothetical protein [Desulfobacteraceae bacterium]
MNCTKCQTTIEHGEDRELHGQCFCEDCYMDMLSPAKACDPWAVYSAKSFEKWEGNAVMLTPLRQKILDMLKETGGMEPAMLCEKLNMKSSDLEREIAALRHVEKVRGELRAGNKFICLW